MQVIVSTTIQYKERYDAGLYGFVKTHKEPKLKGFAADIIKALKRYKNQTAASVEQLNEACKRFAEAMREVNDIK